MHSAGFELTKLTYTRLEDNLIRHRGDRLSTGGRGATILGEGVSTNGRGIIAFRPEFGLYVRILQVMGVLQYVQRSCGVKITKYQKNTSTSHQLCTVNAGTIL